MTWLNRIRLILTLRNIQFFIRMHREFGNDRRYSVTNLIRALWAVSKDDRIVRHNDMFVHSSFLPPLPSRAAEQVFDAVAGAGTVFEDHVNALRRGPISMYVAVTGRCSYHCRHCSAAGHKQHREWYTRELAKLFSDLQDMGTAIIGLSGGEPLLRDDLCELISGIDDRSVTFLFTSGRGLSLEKARELQQAGLFAVGISLDSADSLEMDEIRGVEGAFGTAIEAIRNCRAAGLYTMTQTVATPGKLGSGALEAIVRLSASVDVHEVRILESMPTGRLVRVDSSKILTEREREELKDFHVRLNRRRGYPKVSVFAHTEDHSRYGCGAGLQHSYIDAAGNLYPCDFVPLAFGNVREEPVAKAWLRMHGIIGKPRRQCMIMELYTRKLLDDRIVFPLSIDASRECMQQLEAATDMPGFYRMLQGDYLKTGSAGGVGSGARQQVSIGHNQSKRD